MLLNTQSASNIKFGLGYNHTECPLDFSHKIDNDGKPIETLESTEVTSFHQNYLKVDEKSSSVVSKTSDVKPSAVPSISEVETLKTAEGNLVKPKNIKEESATNSNKKGKTKACEACGMFNHSAENCRYRMGRIFSEEQKMLKDGKVIKRQFRKTWPLNKHQHPSPPVKTAEKSQPQHVSYKSKKKNKHHNACSEVLTTPSAVSQTAEVNQLVNLVKLLLTHVDGSSAVLDTTAETAETIVPKVVSVPKSAWIPKQGHNQTVSYDIPKSKPKAKVAWVPRSN